MNKKEIAELKKLTSSTNCSFSRICGCYVDAEKNIKATFANQFLALSEESIFKYLDLFKKGMSGTIGKNMFNLSFPLSEETTAGTTHSLLMKLRDSELKDADTLEIFFQNIIDTYVCEGNYLILLVFNAYDIPGKSSDGFTMDDASDEVFSYITGVICPVDLSKPGLSYHEDQGNFQECVRYWIAGQPDIGFVFPAFNDRTTDIHKLLYHTKNAKEVHLELVEDFFHCTFSSTADEQKETFQSVVENTLGDDCTFDNIKSVISGIDQAAEENADNPEPTEVGERMMLSFLEDHIADESNFKKAWEDNNGDTAKILLSNIASNGKCTFAMGDITIQANNATYDVVELKEINGKKCIVIPYEGDMTINGITVK